VPPVRLETTTKRLTADGCLGLFAEGRRIFVGEEGPAAGRQTGKRQRRSGPAEQTTRTSAPSGSTTPSSRTITPFCTRPATSMSPLSPKSPRRATSRNPPNRLTLPLTHSHGNLPSGNILPKVTGRTYVRKEGGLEADHLPRRAWRRPPTISAPAQRPFHHPCRGSGTPARVRPTAYALSPRAYFNRRCRGSRDGCAVWSAPRLESEWIPWRSLTQSGAQRTGSGAPVTPLS
jgi:hypothetical protein